MKEIKLLILFIFLHFGLQAQINLTEYEYWFNQDFSTISKVSITPANNYLLQSEINVSSLSEGLNVLNIRFKDENNLYSNTLSKLFLKYSLPAPANTKLTSYEYWYNSDFKNSQVVPFSAASPYQIIEDLDIATLPEGLNILHIRFKDENGLYSNIFSKVFLKNTQSLTTDIKLKEYQYWFNNDVTNTKIITITPATQQELITDIDVSTLQDGVNIIHYRYKDENEWYSTTRSKIFYKNGMHISQPTLTAYKYWFNDDYTQAVTTVLPEPVHDLDLTTDLDMTKMPKGAHTIHFQFADSLGQWSSVTTDSITKIAFPIADFTYSLIENCDSTIVSFTNNSIDADSLLWTFGTGDTDSIQNPNYIYKSAGIYTITLLAKDTLTQSDSLKTIEIPIKGKTSFVLDTAVCNSYTSPSGKFIWVNSGNYNDTINNSWGCDSLLTIQLQVKPAYSIWETVFVCEGSDYTFPDGYKITNLSTDADHTSSLQTILACDSTIYTHLSVIHIDTTVTQNGATLTSNQEGASYRWVDCELNYANIEGANNKIFTATQNGNYAAIISISSCSDTTSCFAVTTIAINENSFKQEIKMYPNPVQDYLHLSFENTQEKVEINICDIHGKQLESKQHVNIKSLLLNMQHLQQGNYIIQVKAGNKQAHYKILKK